LTALQLKVTNSAWTFRSLREDVALYLKMLFRSALLGVVLNTCVAHASVLTFDASGVFDGGYTLGGTVTIDNTLGSVVASDLTISGAPALPNPDSFTTILAASPSPVGGGLFDFNVDDSAGNIFSSGFTAPTLVGFTGGSFCSELTPNLCGSALEDFSNSFSFYELQSGTLSLAVSAVPELSTWAMMILGFCGVGFLAYRQKALGFV
jgi:hypothetical protein